MDPYAEMIYQEKIKWIDKKQTINSPLYRRVICLSYKFEFVLPKLKNVYLDTLIKSKKEEKEQLKRFRKGLDPRWESSIKLYLDSEHYEKVEELIKKVKWEVLEFGIKFIYLMKITIFYLYATDPKNVFKEKYKKIRDKYTQSKTRLLQFIEQNIIDRLEIGYSPDPPPKTDFSINVYFKIKEKNEVKTVTPQDLSRSYLLLDVIQDFLSNKIKSNVIEEIEEELESFSSISKNIKEYLDFWKESKIYDAYYETRKHLHQHFPKSVNIVQQSSAPIESKRLKERIEQVEKNEFRKKLNLNIK